MFLHESIRKRGTERLIRTAFFTAPCQEVNPIELYYQKEGYPYKCRTCKKTATYKMLFLSPKHEVEGDFGPVYFCKDHVPDVNKVAKTDNYYKTLYGK